MQACTLWALRIHVNSQTEFYSLLAFFFLIREPQLSKRSVDLSAICFGLAVGSKIIAGLIGPVIAIQLLNQLYWPRPNYRWMGRYVLISVLAFWAAAFPTVLVPGMIISSIKSYVSQLSYYVKFSHVSEVTVPEMKLGFIFDYFTKEYVSPAVLVLLLALFLLPWLSTQKKWLRPPFASIGIGLLIGLGYCFFRVHKGAFYTTSYFLALYPFLFLSVAALPRSRWVWGLMVAILGAEGMANGTHRWDWMNHYSDVEVTEKALAPKRAMDEISSLLGSRIRDQKVTFLRAHPALFPLTAVDQNASELVSFYRNYLVSNCSGQNFDYILLHQDNFFGVEHAATYATDPEQVIQSQKALAQFREDGICGGNHYKLIYDKNDVLLYERDEPSLKP